MESEITEEGILVDTPIEAFADIKRQLDMLYDDSSKVIGEVEHANQLGEKVNLLATVMAKQFEDLRLRLNVHVDQKRENLQETALNENERSSAEQTIQHLEQRKEVDDKKEKQEKSSLIKTDVEAGTQLHRTHRMFDMSVKPMFDVPVKPNYLGASSSFDSDDSGFPLCGKALHRCANCIDVSIPLSEEERKEFISILYDGEIVDIGSRDIKTNMDCAGKLDKSREHNTNDLSGYSKQQPEERDDAKMSLDNPEFSKTKPVGLITTLRTLINNTKTTKINPVARGSEKAARRSLWHTNDS